MTRTQFLDHASHLYPFFDIYPWMVLANGEALCLNYDRVLTAGESDPPRTIEVLFTGKPQLAWTSPAKVRYNYYYWPYTYTRIYPTQVWRYVARAGGIIGLVDAAQDADHVFRDIRAHFPEKE